MGLMLAVLSLSATPVAFAAADVSIQVGGEITESSVVYRLTYDAGGGTGSYTESKASGETHTVLSPSAIGITRGGCAFTGWNSEPDGSGAAYATGDTITVEGDMTFYAQWKKVVTVQDTGKGTDTGKSSGTAKTGDGSNMSLWIGALLISLAAMAALWEYRRKRRAT